MVVLGNIMRKPSFPPACKIYKVQMYGINRYRAGTARINACGDSRIRGQRSRKPIGFRQWVVHSNSPILAYPSFNTHLPGVFIQQPKQPVQCRIVPLSEIIYKSLYVPGNRDWNCSLLKSCIKIFIFLAPLSGKV